MHLYCILILYLCLFAWIFSSNKDCFLFSGFALKSTMMFLRCVMDDFPLHILLEVTRAPRFPSSSSAPPTSCFFTFRLTRATLTLASVYVTKVRAHTQSQIHIQINRMQIIGLYFTHSDRN